MSGAQGNFLQKQIQRFSCALKMNLTSQPSASFLFVCAPGGRCTSVSRKAERVGAKHRPKLALEYACSSTFWKFKAKLRLLCVPSFGCHKKIVPTSMQCLQIPNRQKHTNNVLLGLKFFIWRMLSTPLRTYNTQVDQIPSRGGSNYTLFGMIRLKTHYNLNGIPLPFIALTKEDAYGALADERTRAQPRVPARTRLGFPPHSRPLSLCVADSAPKNPRRDQLKTAPPKILDFTIQMK